MSRKKGEAGARDEEAGRKQQAAVRAMLGSLPDKLFLDRAVFEDDLSEAARRAELKLAAPVRKAILSALSERNAEAEICRDRDGRPEPDPELRDTENVPLGDDVESFFAREVKPHVPDAWIDTERRDPQDGEVGLVGYEINFNRYFYEYRPPRPLEEIEADIQRVEKEIVAMLRGCRADGARAAPKDLARCSPPAKSLRGYGGASGADRSLSDGSSSEVRPVSATGGRSGNSTTRLSLPPIAAT